MYLLKKRVEDEINLIYIIYLKRGNSHFIFIFSIKNQIRLQYIKINLIFK